MIIIINKLYISIFKNQHTQWIYIIKGENDILRHTIKWISNTGK